MDYAPILVLLTTAGCFHIHTFFCLYTRPSVWPMASKWLYTRADMADLHGHVNICHSELMHGSHLHTRTAYTLAVCTNNSFCISTLLAVNNSVKTCCVPTTSGDNMSIPFDLHMASRLAIDRLTGRKN